MSTFPSLEYIFYRGDVCSCGGGVVGVGGVVGGGSSSGRWEKSREGGGCVGRGPPRAQYRRAQYSTVQYSTVQYSTVQTGPVLHRRQWCSALPRSVGASPPREQHLI